MALAFGSLHGACCKSFNYLGGTLTEVSPFIGSFSKTMFVCSFGTPNDASAGSRGVKTGMGAVALMCIAKLAVDGRV